MIIFGQNIFLAELFLGLIIVFIILVLMIWLQLHNIKKMTSEEKAELAELEKLAESQRHDIEQIKAYETRENAAIGKFEQEIQELESDTDTLYLKKLAPDLYKLQNYVLWAMQKGLSSEQIKANLVYKGWKDSNLVEMVINDTLKYFGYYKKQKGEVKLPDVKVKDERKMPVTTSKPVVKEVKPIPTIKQKSVVKKSVKPKPKKDGLYKDVAQELKALEKDLKKEKKKKLVSKKVKKTKSKSSKKAVKPTKKKVKKVKKTAKKPKKTASKTIKKKKTVVRKRTLKTGKKKKPQKKSTFSQNEKQVEQLEKELAGKTKKSTKKTAKKKKTTSSKKDKKVVLHADKDVDVEVKYQ